LFFLAATALGDQRFDLFDAEISAPFAAAPPAGNPVGRAEQAEQARQPAQLAGQPRTCCG
jgi:hypothetical protein